MDVTDVLGDVAEILRPAVYLPYSGEVVRFDRPLRVRRGFRIVTRGLTIVHRHDLPGRPRDLRDLLDVMGGEVLLLHESVERMPPSTNVVLRALVEVPAEVSLLRRFSHAREVIAATCRLEALDAHIAAGVSPLALHDFVHPWIFDTAPDIECSPCPDPALHEGVWRPSTEVSHLPDCALVPWEKLLRCGDRNAPWQVACLLEAYPFDDETVVPRRLAARLVGAGLPYDEIPAAVADLLEACKPTTEPPQPGRLLFC